MSHSLSRPRTTRTDAKPARATAAATEPAAPADSARASPPTPSTANSPTTNSTLPALFCIFHLLQRSCFQTEATQEHFVQVVRQPSCFRSTTHSHCPDALCLYPILRTMSTGITKYFSEKMLRASEKGCEYGTDDPCHMSDMCGGGSILRVPIHPTNPAAMPANKITLTGRIISAASPWARMSTCPVSPRIPMSSQTVP